MKPGTPTKLPSGAPVLTATIALPADSFTVIASPPELLSQINVEVVIAVSSRVYLETIRAPGFPLAVMKLGKLRLVDRAAFVGWLRSQAAASSSTSTAPANDSAGVDVQEGDGVLAEIGLERVPAPTGRKRASAAGRA